MKRPIIIGLTALTVVGLVGCSSHSDTKVEDNNSQKTEEQSSENTQNNSSKKVYDNENSTSYLGKVSDIIGNQVTIKLIDGEFELTDEMKSAMGIVELTEEQQKQLDRGEVVMMPDGFMMKSVEAKPGELDDDPGLSVEDLKEQGIDVEGEEAAERAKKQAIINQMEFNGDSKDFTIPAGVDIHNDLVGYNAKISDIKKGSIVEFTTDKETNKIVRIIIKF